MAFDLVVVGTSLGGLRALEVLLAGLPKSFPASMVIVQHRHKDSEDTLSALLQQHTPLPLTEPEDKEVILPGHIYLAPADYHLLIEAPDDDNDRSASQQLPYFTLSIDAPVEYARPSIDVLFHSAADAYAQKVIGVILTGSNQDGVQGLAQIKASGGLTVVQAPATAESPTMPKAAINAVAVDWILSLVEIAPFVAKLFEQ